MNPWDQIKVIIGGKISPDAYQNWVAGTKFISSVDGHLRVAVPDETCREWMQQEYAGEVWSAVRELHLGLQQVIYECERATETAPASPMARQEVSFSTSMNLNPKFTFESFVVGSCNQFAHAAAQAVANVPSSTYNPLFIYGGVGMGKTHLMHAIGQSLQTRHTGMKIVYTSSERFMNEVINCIRLDKMQTFHRHYRSADVLLIDDIQFIGGTRSTQEEVFHTFNELYEHNKQIIVSSDSPPKSMPGLAERLRSRFEWGLMVDVQPPDLETKMAILDKKSQSDGIHLPEDVRILIATRTKSNVRELEGALIKLLAYSSVTGTPINLAMANQVLKHMTNPQEKKVTVDAVLRAVADRFGLQPAQLKLKTNARQISYPRQIAMYLIKELTTMSLPEIGRSFSGKHHTTVLHSIQKIEQLRHKEADLNNLLHNLSDSLR